MMPDDDGVPGTARDGSAAVVVPEVLKEEVLKCAHGSKLTGHNRYRRTIACMKEKY